MNDSFMKTGGDNAPATSKSIALLDQNYVNKSVPVTSSVRSEPSANQQNSGKSGNSSNAISLEDLFGIWGSNSVQIATSDKPRKIKLADLVNSSTGNKRKITVVSKKALGGTVSVLSPNQALHDRPSNDTISMDESLCEVIDCKSSKAVVPTANDLEPCSSVTKTSKGVKPLPCDSNPKQCYNTSEPGTSQSCNETPIDQSAFAKKLEANKKVSTSSISVAKGDQNPDSKNEALSKMKISQNNSMSKPDSAENSRNSRFPSISASKNAPTKSVGNRISVSLPVFNLPKAAAQKQTENGDSIVLIRKIKDIRDKLMASMQSGEGIKPKEIPKNQRAVNSHIPSDEPHVQTETEISEHSILTKLKSKRKSTPVKCDFSSKRPRIFLTQKQIRKLPNSMKSSSKEELYDRVMRIINKANKLNERNDSTTNSETILERARKRQLDFTGQNSAQSDLDASGKRALCEPASSDSKVHARSCSTSGLPISAGPTEKSKGRKTVIKPKDVSSNSPDLFDDDIPTILPRTSVTIPIRDTESKRPSQVASRDKPQTVNLHKKLPVGTKKPKVQKKVVKKMTPIRPKRQLRVMISSKDLASEKGAEKLNQILKAGGFKIKDNLPVVLCEKIKTFVDKPGQRKRLTKFRIRRGDATTSQIKSVKNESMKRGSPSTIKTGIVKNESAGVSDDNSNKRLSYCFIPRLSDILMTIDPRVKVCCFCHLPANHLLGLGDLFGPYRPLAEEVLARQDAVNEHLRAGREEGWHEPDPAHAADGSPMVAIDKDEETCTLTARLEADDQRVYGSGVNDITRAISKSSHHLRSLSTIEHVLQDAGNSSWQNKQKFLRNLSEDVTVRIPGPKSECKVISREKGTLKSQDSGSKNDPVLPNINSIVFLEPKINLPHSDNGIVTSQQPSTLTSPQGSSITPRRPRSQRKSITPRRYTDSTESRIRSPIQDPPTEVQGDSTSVCVSHKFNTSPLWCHGYCAVWADGVYAIRGQLYGLWDAAKTSSQILCTLCSRPGATIVTYEDKQDFKRTQVSLKAYHYPCALHRNLKLNWNTLTANIAT